MIPDHELDEMQERPVAGKIIYVKVFEHFHNGDVKIVEADTDLTIREGDELLVSRPDGCALQIESSPASSPRCGG